MAASEWTLGRCHWKHSNQCDGTAKPGEVTCRHCSIVCTIQQEEESKQAFNGVYCSTFACWKQSVVSWGACKACRKKSETPETPPHDAATGAGAPQARTPQARTPSPGVHVSQNWVGRTPLDLNSIVDTATTAELRDLIILASQRMHYFLQPYE